MLCIVCSGQCVVYSVQYAVVILFCMVKDVVNNEKCATLPQGCTVYGEEHFIVFVYTLYYVV